MKKAIKVISIILALSLVFAFAACKKGGGDETTAAPADTDTTAAPEAADLSNIKFGLICLHDENSTYDNNFIMAAKEAQAALGLSDDQVLIKTNVDESNACYEAACDLAELGCNIIMADSFGHETYMKQAAQEYPDVQFCHATGTSSKSAGIANFHNAFATIYEGRYLAGVVAGLKLNAMIEAGDITADKAVIGYVAAFPYAEVKSGYTSFFLGARSVCESATMKVVYTNSWFDIDLEKTAAENLINDGCVLISQHADSEGAPKACEAAGVPDVAYNIDTSSIAPNTALVSSRINWAPYYEMVINAVAAGETFATDWIGTIATGSVELLPLSANCTDDAAAKVEEVKAALADGSVKVFDCATFTVNGENLAEYTADVVDEGDFVPETNVILTDEATGITYFAESDEQFRSAPYFDILIDGITELG
ncbi:MAG: BMP family ABC transporter substrate-binding protein [Clostridia bacterium]|nr:BMP family ABC transporter substrate-binding protein [Clostridia bacterium]